MDAINEKTVCYTGHRTIPESDFEELYQKLLAETERQIQNGASCFRTGGAKGFDTMAALAVLSLKLRYPRIRLELFLPCPTQTKGWSENDVAVYEQIRAKADACHYVSSFYYNGILQVRNRRLVEGSDVCIAYLTDSKGGGTAYTCTYAIRQGLEFINLQNI